MGCCILKSTRSNYFLRQVLSTLAGVVLASPVAAHGFAQRYDLPVPLWLYLTGAAATLLLSFVLIALFMRQSPESSTADPAHPAQDYPRLNLLKVPLLRLLAAWPLQRLLQWATSLLFLLVLIAGGWGVQQPFNNLAPTMVWVIGWVGLAYLSGLLGNLWLLINPWSNLYLAAQWLLQRVRPQSRSALNLPYPQWLGCWPGVVLFALFGWLELIWPQSDQPASIASVMLGYSLICWLGMALFGRQTWLQRGEVFSLFFSLLARFAPTELRQNNSALCASCRTQECRNASEGCFDCPSCYRRASSDSRQWNVRPPVIGLLTVKPVSFSLCCFVLLMLAIVTFDGFMATPLWADIVQWALYADLIRPLLLALQPFFDSALTLISSLGMVLFILLFIVAYLLFCLLMRRAADTDTNAQPLRALAGSFVLTLIPIALAYHLSHYLSYLLIVGQYMIPLLSDPFGYGWDLFGTGHYFVDIGIINARTVWITSVTVIVIGHICSIYLAHRMAQRVFSTARQVLRSQIPMLGLMIGYTMISLWILAQPVVE